MFSDRVGESKDTTFNSNSEDDNEGDSKCSCY